MSAFCVGPGWIGLDRAYAELAAMPPDQRVVRPELIPPADVVAAVIEFVADETLSGGIGIWRAAHPSALSVSGVGVPSAEVSGLDGSSRYCCIWSSLQSMGALSSRQRRILVPCRIRPPLTWSKVTSTTSSGRSSIHSSSLSLCQRLGSP